jgi:hypothetical protein
MITVLESSATSLECPVPRCRTVNGYAVEDCAGCGTPLVSYARLSAYPAKLFDLGLFAARADPQGARHRWGLVLSQRSSDTMALELHPQG